MHSLAAAATFSTALLPHIRGALLQATTTVRDFPPLSLLHSLLSRSSAAACTLIRVTKTYMSREFHHGHPRPATGPSSVQVLELEGDRCPVHGRAHEEMKTESHVCLRPGLHRRDARSRERMRTRSVAAVSAVQLRGGELVYECVGGGTEALERRSRAILPVAMQSRTFVAAGRTEGVGEVCVVAARVSQRS